MEIQYIQLSLQITLLNSIACNVILINVQFHADILQFFPNVMIICFEFSFIIIMFKIMDECVIIIGRQ